MPPMQKILTHYRGYNIYKSANSHPGSKTRSLYFYPTKSNAVRRRYGNTLTVNQVLDLIKEDIDKHITNLEAIQASYEQNSTDRC